MHMYDSRKVKAKVWDWTNSIDPSFHLYVVYYASLILQISMSRCTKFRTQYTFESYKPSK
jgi:hypothetical protein